MSEGSRPATVMARTANPPNIHARRRGRAMVRPMTSSIAAIPDTAAAGSASRTADRTSAAAPVTSASDFITTFIVRGM